VGKHIPSLKHRKESEVIFLAINYGSEGWHLQKCVSTGDAIQKVKNGQTFGNEWKILKELNLTIERSEEDGRE